jgi:hypothetical protein
MSFIHNFSTYLCNQNFIFFTFTNSHRNNKKIKNHWFTINPSIIIKLLQKNMKNIILYTMIMEKLIYIYFFGLHIFICFIIIYILLGL